MEYKFRKEAEWRKWDLHIHTPCSIYQKLPGEYGMHSHAGTWEQGKIIAIDAPVAEKFV